MRYLVTLLLVLSVFGCAHARTVSWHNNEVTICANRNNDEVFLKELKKTCDGEGKLTGESSEERRVDIAPYYGQSPYAQKSYTVFNPCRTYQCSVPLKLNSR